MTDKNKEAIEKLGYIKNQYHTLLNFDDYDEVFDNAIKALEERPTGHWFLLDECSNEGVYCSNCHKKVYRVEYANQRVKSNYCPNCGADMRGDRE